VLELLINLVVATPMFAHSCFNHLVTNLLPPPAPPSLDLRAGEPWVASEDETDAQDAIILALEKVRALVRHKASLRIAVVVGAHAIIASIPLEGSATAATCLLHWHCTGPEYVSCLGATITHPCGAHDSLTKPNSTLPCTCT
jgi:hypothetical protein